MQSIDDSHLYREERYQNELKITLERSKEDHLKPEHKRDQTDFNSDFEDKEDNDYDDYEDNNDIVKLYHREDRSFRQKSASKASKSTL